MTLVRVVGKGRTEPLTRAALDDQRAESTRTLVDVGTGDARYAYAIATQRPDWFVLGIDALDEPMGETAAKAARKPARGGRANLVLLRASAESLPAELDDVADEVHVLLPWGRLLEGIVLGDDAVLHGLARLGPRLHVVLNGEIWEESMPARFAHLPVPTPEYVAAHVAPAFALVGVEVGVARVLSAEDAKALPTTWARKLAHGRTHPRFIAFDGCRRIS